MNLRPNSRLALRISKKPASGWFSQWTEQWWKYFSSSPAPIISFMWCTFRIQKLYSCLAGNCFSESQLLLSRDTRWAVYSILSCGYNIAVGRRKQSYIKCSGWACFIWVLKSWEKQEKNKVWNSRPWQHGVKSTHSLPSWPAQTSQLTHFSLTLFYFYKPREEHKGEKSSLLFLNLRKKKKSELCRSFTINFWQLLLTLRSEIKRNTRFQ